MSAGKPVLLSERIRHFFKKEVEGAACPACGRKASLATIAEEIGTSDQTLRKFLDGGTPRTTLLDAVDAWLAGRKAKP